MEGRLIKKRKRGAEYPEKVLNEDSSKVPNCKSGKNKETEASRALSEPFFLKPDNKQAS
jgi:hypothetical protein